MLHWTFGLTLLLLLSTWITPLNADEEGNSHNIEVENVRTHACIITTIYTYEIAYPAAKVSSLKLNY